MPALLLAVLLLQQQGWLDKLQCGWCRPHQWSSTRHFGRCTSRASRARSPEQVGHNAAPCVRWSGLAAAASPHCWWAGSCVPALLCGVCGASAAQADALCQLCRFSTQQDG